VLREVCRKSSGKVSTLPSWNQTSSPRDSPQSILIQGVLAFLDTFDL